jgi:hypothetical protein
MNNMLIWVELDYDGCYMDMGMKYKKLVGLKKLGRGLYWEKNKEGSEGLGVLYIDKVGYCYNDFKYMIEGEEMGADFKIQMDFIYRELDIDSVISYEEYMVKVRMEKRWQLEKLERIKRDLGV